MRARLEADDEAWLLYFFAGPDDGQFQNGFTEQHRLMIAGLRSTILHGGDLAIAAPRGSGKTGICRRGLLKYHLSGELNFSIFFAANASKAAQAIQSLRNDIETNDKLWALYPEVCAPVRGLGNRNQKAYTMTVCGHRHDTGEPYVNHLCKYSWCGHALTLPNVPGSPSSSSALSTRSLEAEVVGESHNNCRPQFALIDDPDTEDTILTEAQARKLERRINASIGGLGGPTRRIARVMVTTVHAYNCASAWFTDRKRYPTWRGQRFRYLVTPPDRADLWEEYARLYREDMETGDEYGRRAHAFYVANREAMDAGHAVGNPWRFNGKLLADGSPLEISSLQAYYNYVIANGETAARTELDNDPPPIASFAAELLSPLQIARRVNGYPQRIVPPGVVRITRGIDCGAYELHWVVVAWLADATGYVIDYGVEQTDTQRGGSRTFDEVGDAADRSIPRALRNMHDRWAVEPYLAADGAEHRVDVTFVDAGYRLEAIRHACAAIGWMPTKGVGRSSDYRGTFRATGKRGWQGGCMPDREAGDRAPLVARLDADSNLRFVHDRLRVSAGSASSLTLWGEGNPTADESHLSKDQRYHLSRIAAHVCAQQLVADPGKGDRWGYFTARGEEVRGAPNHWLDALGMAASAGLSTGAVKIGGQQVAARRRMTPAEMKQAAIQTTTPGRKVATLEAMQRAAR